MPVQKLKMSKNKKFFTSPKKSEQGQAMVESILLIVLTLVFIFGIMDLARLGWTMFHLHGAAQAAARAASVGKSPTAAANLVTQRALGLSFGSLCGVDMDEENITCDDHPPFPFIKIGSLLPTDKTQIKAIKATVWYRYQPLFPFGLMTEWTTGIPVTLLSEVFLLRVSCRMNTEVPIGDPWS